MMGTLDVTTAVRIFGTHKASADLTDPVESIDIPIAKRLTNGTGTDQGNEFWSDQRTVTGASETLNIQDGSLSNSFGTTLTLAKVKHLLIFNRSTKSGNTLTVSGDFLTSIGSATNIVVHPGGWLFLTSPIDGYTVTATTADEITINPGAATITYDIAISGVT